MLIPQRIMVRVNDVRQRLGWSPYVTEPDDVVEILPNERVQNPDIVRLPGMVERLVHGNEITPLEETLRVFSPEGRIATGLRMNVFRDALVWKNGIVGRGGEGLRLGSRDPALLAPRRVRYVETVKFCRNVISHRFFGDTLRFDLPIAASPLVLGRPIVPTRSDWPHLTQYLAAAQLGTLHDPVVRAGTVYTPKVPPGFSTVWSEQISSLRDRILTRFGSPMRFKPGEGNALLVSRGPQGAKRTLENEQDLIDLGLRRLDVVGMELADLAEAFSSASLVVAVEGSQLSHFLYLSPARTAILLLMPPDRAAAAFFEIAEALGHFVGFVAMKGENGSYSADPEEVRLTAQLLRERQARGA